MHLEFIFLYLIVGSCAGFLAGLLGVGGGLIIVPTLMFIFESQHFNPTHAFHMALGTAMATIVFTAISSVRAHYKRGAVRVEIARLMIPGAFMGTFFGSYLASQIPSFGLKVFFVCFAYYVTIQMTLNIKPKPSRQFPGWAGTFVAGNIIGVVSSFVGIGGATMSIPFMTWCNVAMHHAIATSAAIGFPIAVAGSIGYIINGLRVEGLPPHTLGFIHLPSLLSIAIASVLMAPIGAKVAHKLPVAQLKKVFAGLLFILGTKMLISLF